MPSWLKEGPLSQMRSSAAMASLCSDQAHALAVATLHRELFAPMGEGARQPESFANPRDPHKRLRLGLVTADFHHQHPVNIFMQPVLARWNPEDIQITVYFTGVSYDEQTLLAKRRVSHWVEVTTLNDAQLARRIEEDGIDVLLDFGRPHRSAAHVVVRQTCGAGASHVFRLPWLHWCAPYGLDLG
jgi:predicted O-linked N-acetylglucosamine transferase (SPINDLY family)